MAPRAYWSGQLRLALVSIPVEVFSATKSGGRISFHQVHEPSRKRVRYEKVVPGRELIAARIEDRAPEHVEAPETGGKVIDLMEALKRSVGDKGKGGAKGGKRGRAA